MSKTERVLVTRESVFIVVFPEGGDWTVNQKSLWGPRHAHARMPGTPYRDSSCKCQRFAFSFVCVSWELKGNHGRRVSFKSSICMEDNRVGPERISKLNRSDGSNTELPEPRLQRLETAAFINPVDGRWLWDIGLFLKNLLVALCVGFHMDLIKLKNEMIQKAGLQIAPSLFLVWIGTPTVYDLDLGSLQIPIRFLEHHTLLRRYEQLPCRQPATVCSPFHAQQACFCCS